MIEVKEAVQKAKIFLRDISEDKPVEMRLEEVEVDEQEHLVKVTLSYIPLEGPGLGTIYPREYKIFDVDGDSGKVRSMKIRSFA